MTLVDTIKQVCHESGIEFCSDYSGRAMYGDRCIGIVGSVSECTKVIAIVIQNLNEELFDNAVSMGDHNVNEVYDFKSYVQSSISELLDYRMDSMGYDYIFYWPDLTCADEEEEYEEEDVD